MGDAVRRPAEEEPERFPIVKGAGELAVDHLLDPLGKLYVIRRARNVQLPDNLQPLGLSQDINNKECPKTKGACSQS